MLFEDVFPYDKEDYRQLIRFFSMSINGDMPKVLAGYANGSQYRYDSCGFNLLNTPDEYYVNPEQFWNEYNKPFLDAAIERDDVFLMATPINEQTMFTENMSSLSGYGREIEYLFENGYEYIEGEMVKIIGG